MKKYLFSVLFILGIVMAAPTMVSAQQAKSTPNASAQSAQQDQCAKLLEQINNAGGGRVSTLPAYCNTNTIYTKILGFAYYIIGIASVISLMYGGYLYMVAGSNESQVKKSKNIIMWTLAGIALAVVAGLIVNAVINLVVDNKFF